MICLQQAEQKLRVGSLAAPGVLFPRQMWLSKGFWSPGLTSARLHYELFSPIIWDSLQTGRKERGHVLCLCPALCLHRPDTHHASSSSRWSCKGETKTKTPSTLLQGRVPPEVIGGRSRLINCLHPLYFDLINI